MRLLAERNCEDLSRELLVYKDKVGTIQNQMDILRAENQTLQVITVFKIFDHQIINRDFFFSTG